MIIRMSETLRLEIKFGLIDSDGQYFVKYIQRQPQWEVCVGDKVSALQSPKKKRFRLENQCKHTPRNTKTFHGGFCIQVTTKFGASPRSLYPISLYLSYAFFLKQ